MGSLIRSAVRRGRRKVATTIVRKRSMARRIAGNLRILACTFNFRNINNFATVLDLAISRGAAVELLLFPHLNDPSHHLLSSLRYQVGTTRPIGGDAGFVEFEELVTIVGESIARFRPNLIVSDDMAFAHTRHILPAVVAYCHDHRIVRPPVVVTQHGLCLNWLNYTRLWRCDYFLSFGDKHRRQFPRPMQWHTFPVGLPKLDRLRDMPTSDEGYVLYIAQDTPRPEIVALALREFHECTGLPIKIKPHPEWVNAIHLPDGSDFSEIPVDDDIVPHIARSHGVITSGSTSGLEALLLDKPLVCLPSKSSSAYADSPFLCSGFRGSAIKERFEANDEEGVKMFLDDNIGGKRFDSTERMLCALETIRCEWALFGEPRAAEGE